MYTTADDAKSMVRATIESGGAAGADAYDIDAIFDDTFEYSPDLGRFVQTADEDGFWAAVEEHAL